MNKSDLNIHDDFYVNYVDVYYGAALAGDGNSVASYDLIQKWQVGELVPDQAYGLEVEELLISYKDKLIYVKHNKGMIGIPIRDLKRFGIYDETTQEQEDYYE